MRGPRLSTSSLAQCSCADYRKKGKYYGVAAAIGKIGAFVGTWGTSSRPASEGGGTLLITISYLVFPYIQAAAGDNEVASAQYPFWVSSSLCVLSAALALFCLPHISQDTIQIEDARFRAYLEANGYDTRQLGMKRGDVFESTDADMPVQGLAEAAQGEKAAA